MISVFQIQSKYYIAKYSANPKTQFCLYPNSCHCCQLNPMWRRDYAINNIEFGATIEEWTQSNGEWQIATVLRVEGSTLSLVGSERRSIVAAANGTQRIGGWNPPLKFVLSLWNGKFFWNWIGLDIFSDSTGTGFGLSQWSKLQPCKKLYL